jgi:hypothetical protein
MPLALGFKGPGIFRRAPEVEQAVPIGNAKAHQFPVENWIRTEGKERAQCRNPSWNGDDFFIKEAARGAYGASLMVYQYDPQVLTEVREHVTKEASTMDGRAQIAHVYGKDAIKRLKGIGPVE